MFRSSWCPGPERVLWSGVGGKGVGMARQAAKLARQAAPLRRQGDQLKAEAAATTVAPTPGW